MQLIQHDLTSTPYGIVAHGCNCLGTMGAGVAEAVRKKWPDVFYQYAKLVTLNRMTTATPAALLGRAQKVVVDPLLSVYNCFTQVYTGHPSERHANLEAIRTSLDIVLEDAAIHDLPCFIPQIGCGLGGLDWESEVKPAILELEEKHKADIIVCYI